jgi:hypothetical protein
MAFPVPGFGVSVEGQTVATSASPATQTITTNYALWTLILKNVSGGDLSTVRLRHRTHEAGPWSPWESVASGLPVAAGSTLSIAETARRAQAWEIELTAASAGSVELWMAGV